MIKSEGEFLVLLNSLTIKRLQQRQKHKTWYHLITSLAAGLKDSCSLLEIISIICKNKSLLQTYLQILLVNAGLLCLSLFIIDIASFSINLANLPQEATTFKNTLFAHSDIAYLLFTVLYDRYLQKQSNKQGKGGANKYGIHLLLIYSPTILQLQFISTYTTISNFSYLISYALLTSYFALQHPSNWGNRLEKSELAFFKNNYCYLLGFGIPLSLVATYASTAVSTLVYAGLFPLLHFKLIAESHCLNKSSLINTIHNNIQLFMPNIPLGRFRRMFKNLYYFLSHR